MIKYASPSITDADIKAVEKVLRSGTLTQGPVVKEFEVAIAEYVGAKYAIAFSSGTSALMAAYQLVFYDRPISMPVVSFVATANVAKAIGREVEFVDIDPVTGLAHGPSRVDVYLAGRTRSDNYAEVADAAHALGSSHIWRTESYTPKTAKVGGGQFASLTVFSTHAIKNITTGEGGIVTTNGEALAEELRLVRSHGIDGRGMVTLGFNYRMTDIQAALGLSQLSRIEQMREYKQDIVNEYNRELARVVEIPPPADGVHWHLYIIQTDERDALQAFLDSRGIESRVTYRPIYEHPYWHNYRKRYPCPNADRFGARCLALPLHCGLSETDVRVVIGTVKEFFRG